MIWYMCMLRWFFLRGGGIARVVESTLFEDRMTWPVHIIVVLFLYFTIYCSQNVLREKQLKQMIWYMCMLRWVFLRRGGGHCQGSRINFV